MVKVSVPATTANLGPGFDTLGCALGLYATAEFAEMPSGLVIEGCDERYCGEDNLMVVAYDRVMEKLGLKRQGLKISFHSEIPISRGLGSSAALIVLGCMAANALHGNLLSKAELLVIANALEGHPDNVAPALFGGLTASFLEGDEPLSVSYALSEKVHFCVLIPDFETSTHEARKVLPKVVPFEDAVYNCSRCVVLAKALENWNEPVIRAALNDRLHQPYRKQLIDEYESVRTICLNAGASAFFISGSGPTCIALSEDAQFSLRIEAAMKELRHTWRVLDVCADRQGAESEVVSC